jgi:hypothetical protein
LPKTSTLPKRPTAACCCRSARRVVPDLFSPIAQVREPLRVPADFKPIGDDVKRAARPALAVPGEGHLGTPMSTAVVTLGPRRGDCSNFVERCAFEKPCAFS